MGVVIAVLIFVLCAIMAIVFMRRPRAAAAVGTSPRDLGALRAALDEWTTIKADCLSHDIEQLRDTGSFVPRLPEHLAARSAEASRVLNRMSSHIARGELREQLSRLITRADEIFTEEALNPGVVTEAWLLDRIRELRELSLAVETAMSDEGADA